LFGGFPTVWFQLYFSIISENALCDFYSVRFFKVCFVAQTVVCVGECAHEFENNVCSSIVGHGILQYQMTPVDGWLFISTISLLTFCLHLAMTDRCALTSPNTVVQLERSVLCVFQTCNLIPVYVTIYKELLCLVGKLPALSLFHPCILFILSCYFLIGQKV
jgi:hypothetical protein